MSASANTLWARALVDELARTGVRDVVLAPGSRSTPLVLAFAADGRFRMRVHLDERSAGFFALGLGKASGRPAVVVTTSGTAAANLLPAVVEAAWTEVPMVVLTADRPPRLRGADANQAIDQVRLFGVYARAFHELAVPSLDEAALRHVRTVACRAVAAATGAPAGPVHVNVPFDKPLEPVPDDPDLAAFADEHPVAASGRADGAPFVRVGASRSDADGARIDDLVAALGKTSEVVLVAGPSRDPDDAGPAVLALARAAGCPVLADPLSGARYRDAGGAQVVGAYDLYLRDADVRRRLAPSFILRVGASPTSAALQTYLLDHAGARHVVIDGGNRWMDHGATATEYVRADAANTLRRVAEALGDGSSPSGRDVWCELWMRAEAATAEALVDEPAGDAHEGDILRGVVECIPAGGTLFVSSSMPVRDLDAFGSPRAEALHVHANRGASGIDGIVSTAFGVAAATGGPVTCVLGDVAFFHDQNGLLWSREADARVVFVLIDNDGGGIFHMLPVREHEPHFTPYFATPHGLDLKQAAALHGIAFQDVTAAEVGPSLVRALDAGGTRILRVRTERSANRRRHAEVVASVTAGVRRVLGS